MNSIIDIIKEIPHGHGASVKKGISDGILNQHDYKEKLPTGHSLSYERGKKAGKYLQEIIAKMVK